MMKASAAAAPFALAPLAPPPRRRLGATRCLCALCAWPWLTLLAVAAAAVGIAMFDERMRDALDASEAANDVIDGSGLRRWTAVARKCVTAATVVRRESVPGRLRAAGAPDVAAALLTRARFRRRAGAYAVALLQLGATCLGTSLLAVVLASGALRTSRCSLGSRPRPTRGRAAFVYAAALYSFLVALALVAALSAATIGAVGAKAAELVANYGASLTNQARRRRDGRSASRGNSCCESAR